MDCVTKLNRVVCARRSAATLGHLSGALTGGLWLATLIAVYLVNERDIGVSLGWELLIPIGAAIAIAVPLLVLATLQDSLAEWFALSAGSSLGAMGGVSAFLFLAGFAGMGSLIALIALGTLGIAAAVWVAVGVARQTRGAYVVVALCTLSVAAFLPAWYAVHTGGAGESGYFGQAIIATPLGLGAGLGAWTFCALERLRTKHFGGADSDNTPSSEVRLEK
jgi:MFS family permease